MSGIEVTLIGREGSVISVLDGGTGGWKKGGREGKGGRVSRRWRKEDEKGIKGGRKVDRKDRNCRCVSR